MRRAGLLLGLLMWPWNAAADQPLFPFVVSYDARPGVTDVSAWLDAPAGKHGFVRVDDGRFVNDAGPIRFWGTNLCFEACFPDHQQAERMAARLASLGFNCVRMHHMDARSIWGDSPNRLTIDPKKLERLDYLVYQLKRHGIYTNLNLHVSRSFGPNEGFVAQDQRPNYDKGLDNFEPRMIELQRKYARDLLTHVNPYTKTSYVAEPAVAMIEINNEDALWAVWGWGQLDTLPEPYATTFRRLWNQFLRDKYGSTDALRRAWDAGSEPLGDELLAGGDFTRPLDENWHLERDDATVARWTVGDDGPDGRKALEVLVERQGRVAWRPQLVHGDVAVRRGKPFTLSLRARSDQPRSIGVNCMMAHDPWERLGLSAQLETTPEWRPFRFTFLARADDDNARITLTGLTPGRYQLADVSLRPGGIVGLEKDSRLEDDSVSVMQRARTHFTPAARADFADFLRETERRYWDGMFRYLKDELHVRPPVSGTQLSYSPVHVQAGLDYIDAHAYWHHPHFPGRPWDRSNWYVNNKALVNQPGGTLSSLAARRVSGMPFTVSEYNHPAPNEYAAEGFPMIAAVAAFQAWDGVFPFAYCHNTQFEPQKIGSYFDVVSHSTKLVHMPACAAMLVRGHVAPGAKLVEAPLSAAAERDALRRSLDVWSLSADRFGVDAHAALRHRVAIDLTGAARPPEGDDAPTRRFVADTGQIAWGVEHAEAGTFVVDSPATKLFTGFVRGRTLRLGDVTLRIGPTRLDWATVSLTAVDADAIDQPGRVLLAATGVAQNRDAELQRLDGDRITLSDRWGEAPVMCEGIPAVVTLPMSPAQLKCFALDEAGHRRAELPVADADGNAKIELSPTYKTLWYELVVGP